MLRHIRNHPISPAKGCSSRKERFKYPKGSERLGQKPEDGRRNPSVNSVSFPQPRLEAEPVPVFPRSPSRPLRWLAYFPPPLLPPSASFLLSSLADFRSRWRWGRPLLSNVIKQPSPTFTRGRIRFHWHERPIKTPAGLQCPEGSPPRKHRVPKCLARRTVYKRSESDSANLARVEKWMPGNKKRPALLRERS